MRILRSCSSISASFAAVMFSTAVLADVALAGIGHVQLPSGWEEYQPGGDTSCARGDPFSFFVYPGDPERVVFDFMGGGSCFDGAGCDYGSLKFLDRIDVARLGVLFGLPGVNDLSRADNPYAGWTRVFIPYCTGDVHWGNIDKTYKSPNGYSYQIRHRGAVNVKAVVDWSKEHLSDAKRVFVTGCSAGGYGSIFYTPLLQEAFPKAEVDQYADAAVAVPAPGKSGLNIYGWNIEAAAPTWVPELDPKQVDYGKINMDDFYIRAARHYPNIHFSQSSNTQDIVQKGYYPSANKEEWQGRMFSMLDSIHKGIPNFSTYVGSGIGHCSTWDYAFYDTSSNGVKLRDWVSDEANRRVFRDVSCKGNGC